MAFVSVVFFFPMTTEQSNSRDMNYTVVVLGGMLVLSLIWYYFPVYGGVHWFEGPVATVEGHVARRWVTRRDVVEGIVDTIELEKGDRDIKIYNEDVPARETGI
jgi:hypothetical protein